MSAFVIFGVLAALLLMEYLSVGSRAEKLSFRCTADRELTEPGGVVTVTAYVTNSSALPRLFARLWLFFGEGVELREAGVRLPILILAAGILVTGLCAGAMESAIAGVIETVRPW